MLPPWRTNKLHALHQMALLTQPHRERAPPRRFMERFRFPLRCAMLRKNKYTQTMNPRPLNRLLSIWSACGAWADVPACVYGLANVPACEPCRQARQARPRAPPWRTKKLHALPQMSLPNPYRHTGAPPAVYGMVPVALPCAMLRTNLKPAVHEP